MGNRQRRSRCGRTSGDPCTPPLDDVHKTYKTKQSEADAQLNGPFDPGKLPCSLAKLFAQAVHRTNALASPSSHSSSIPRRPDENILSLVGCFAFQFRLRFDDDRHGGVATRPSDGMGRFEELERMQCLSTVVGNGFQGKRSSAGEQGRG